MDRSNRLSSSSFCQVGTSSHFFYMPEMPATLPLVTVYVALPPIGVPGLTPHGLRATFITLAMEHGATLEQTQYAARHSDPRTTERYRKRKMNLDNNAVDRLSFLAREGDGDVPKSQERS